jgi:hypothetical protein
VRRRTDLAFAWAGAPFILLFFIGLMLFADFVPPPSPNDSADQVVALYVDHATSIRTGVLVCYLGFVFFFAWGAGIVRQTRRIPGASPATTYCQVAAFSGAGMIMVFSALFWWTAAYRADTQPAANVQLLNDLAWLTFVLGFVPYIVWAVSVGIAILSDTGDEPLFPRWIGYFSLFVGFALNSSALLAFFKTGPFAWDGVAGWWIPLFDFFSWMIIMIIYTVRAVNRPTATDPLHLTPPGSTAVEEHV